MHKFLCLAILVTVLLASLGTRTPRATAAATQPSTVSFWGMNAYITKRERRDARDNLGVLADTARAAGVGWTREELPWDLIEPYAGKRNGVYDGSLKLTADRGFGIIGMLLTTPGWARDPSCRAPGPVYWCPPARVSDYANFAGWMAERYDGDGITDAPGSPRIAAWEIWNEPNDTLLWPNVGGDDNVRKRRYGEMLIAAYQAIKNADPTALVLTGGAYIYDGGCYPVDGREVCDGLNFFNAGGGVFPQVPAARQAFDVFAIHPFISTNRPDAPEIPSIITVEGRIRTTRTWLNRDIQRSDAPIWITEMGWCTTGGTCPGGVAISEDQQANFLVRSLVIAQQNGVPHVSWFQLEDAFDDPGREWGNADILHDFDGAGYPAKPAYHAYRTLQARLDGAVPQGTGPVNTHTYAPDVSAFFSGNGVYDYRYTRDTTTIDVLWVPQGTEAVTFPVDGSKQILVIDRDGGQTTAQVANNLLSLTVSERPRFIVQQAPQVTPRPTVAPASLNLLAQSGTSQICSSVQVGQTTGSYTLQWTASSQTGWMSITPNKGRSGDSFTLCASPANLPAGGHEGSVVISGTQGEGSVTIPVRLAVANRIYKNWLPHISR